MHTIICLNTSLSVNDFTISPLVMALIWVAMYLCTHPQSKRATPTPLVVLPKSTRKMTKSSTPNSCPNYYLN